MCRNIKRLRTAERKATEAEVHEAALQYIRKISGFRAPSKANNEVFYQAVREVAQVSARLLDELSIKPKTVTSQPAGE